MEVIIKNETNETKLTFVGYGICVCMQDSCKGCISEHVVHWIRCPFDYRDVLRKVNVHSNTILKCIPINM